MLTHGEPKVQWHQLVEVTWHSLNKFPMGRGKAPTLKGLWWALLLSCNFTDQYMHLIPWFISCLLQDYILHDSRDRLLAMSLATKVFNKYLLNGFLKNGWDSEWAHHFVHWLETLEASTIFFSDGTRWTSKSRIQVSLIKECCLFELLLVRPQRAGFYSTNWWVGYVDFLSGLYSDWQATWGTGGGGDTLPAHRCLHLAGKRWLAPKDVIIWTTGRTKAQSKTTSPLKG